MPKDIKELEVTTTFDEAMRSEVVASKILQHLKKHKDKAYSVMEMKKLLTLNDTPQYVNFAIKRYIHSNMERGKKPLIRKKQMYYYYQE